MSIWYCTGHFRYRYPFFGTFDSGIEMAVNTDKFELYFKRADVDQDGRVSGS
ncbi:putative EF-hand domain-containing protein [Helianthus annuus]|nr:putative EF-hand domain-containing protein [Helianthus annuus]